MCTEKYLILHPRIKEMFTQYKVNRREEGKKEGARSLPLERETLLVVKKGAVILAVTMIVNEDVEHSADAVQRTKTKVVK